MAMRTGISKLGTGKGATIKFAIFLPLVYGRSFPVSLGAVLWAIMSVVEFRGISSGVD